MPDLFTIASPGVIDCEPVPADDAALVSPAPGEAEFDSCLAAAIDDAWVCMPAVERRRGGRQEHDPMLVVDPTSIMPLISPPPSPAPFEAMADGDVDTAAVATETGTIDPSLDLSSVALQEERRVVRNTGPAGATATADDGSLEGLDADDGSAPSDVAAAADVPQPVARPHDAALEQASAAKPMPPAPPHTGPVRETPAPSARAEVENGGQPDAAPKPSIARADLRTALDKASTSAAEPVASFEQAIPTNSEKQLGDAGHPPDQRPQLASSKLSNAGLRFPPAAADVFETPATRAEQSTVAPAALAQTEAAPQAADVPAAHVVEPDSRPIPTARRAHIVSRLLAFAPATHTPDAVSATSDVTETRTRADDGTPRRTEPLMSISSTATNVAPVVPQIVTTPAIAVHAGRQGEQPAVPVMPPPETLTQFVQALRVQVREGGGDAVLQLNPQQFGNVSIALKVEGSAVSAMIAADVAEVGEWLESQESALRQGLEEVGLRLERFVVQRDGQQQQRRESSGRPQPPPRRRRDADLSTFEITV